MKSLERAGAVSASGQQRASVRNRRVDRTRKALLAAFIDVLFERGYARLTVREIIARANVGRSTFYEHFQDKEDVMAATLLPILEPLADAAAPAHDRERLRMIVEHMWDSRKRTSAILLGSSKTVMTKMLAEAIAARIRARGAASAPRIDVRLIAEAIACAQIGLLEAWVSGTGRASADEITDALRALARV